MNPFYKPYFLLVLVSMPWAHLTPNSLALSAAGPYHIGDTVTVTWGVTVVHGGVNVDYSSDGGKTWTTIKPNVPARSTGNFSYKWPVTQGQTQQGKLRICQMGGTTPCTNADNTDRPSSGSNYVLISKTLVIEGPTTVGSQSEKVEARSIESKGGFIEASFALAAESPVQIAAFDASGKEVALVYQESFPAGSHRISLFSEALRTHSNWILRLKTISK